jgi:membrane peptidoglycan carboxypeptidase
MGLPQSPSVYGPYANLEAGLERQDVVLDAMVREGYISLDQASDVRLQKLEFTPNEFEIRAPHFVEFIQKQYGMKVILIGLNHTTLLQHTIMNCTNKRFLTFVNLLILQKQLIMQLL